MQAFRPPAPEVLVPRLGEYLRLNELKSEHELRRGPTRRQDRPAEGNPLLPGETMVEPSG